MGELVRRVADDGELLRGPRGLRANILVGFVRLGGPVRRASSRTSRCIWRASSTSTRPSRARGSCASATPSTSRSSSSRTCPASCPARSRSTAGSSATAPSSSTPSPRRRCRRSRVITRKAYGGAYCVMLSKDIADGLQLRLSDGRDRGHGARGRRQHPLPARACGRRAARGAGSEGRGVRRQLRQPLRRGAARVRRRHHRALRDAASVSSGLRAPRGQARRCRRRKHGNIPL